jgi:hypothetical protein
METDSTKVQNSRYAVGGQTEVNSTRLEWWERANYTLDESDTLFVVDKNSAGRLDNVAHVFLGDSHLWWFIAQYNAILDVYAEVVIGRVLRIPTQERAQTMLTGKLGGYPSTREIPTTRITPIV